MAEEVAKQGRLLAVGVVREGKAGEAKMAEEELRSLLAGEEEEEAVTTERERVLAAGCPSAFR